MRVSALQMMLAMFRLPVIAWHLGRAGALGHIAKITLLPAWMRHLCASLDRMVRSGNARRDAGGAAFDQKSLARVIELDAVATPLGL